MKKISELCKRVKIIETNVMQDYFITGIETDSSKVKEGYLFFVTDGNAQYVPDAVKNGAICLIGEKMYDYPCIRVENVRIALSIASSNFYDHPEKKLKIIGVVGTNGKTSITHILYELMKPYKKSAVIGTLGVWIQGEKIESEMTSPDPQYLFAYLSEAARQGVEYAFCEISAHAIFYQKFYGIKCEICVFTNITQDHLDFFEEMERYARVKMNYFSKNNMKTAVINADDPYGQKLLQTTDVCAVSYGIDQPSDVFAIDIENKNGLKFVVNAFDEIFYASTRFEGKFNVYNILAAFTVARLLGVETGELQSRIQMISPIAGRVNRIWQSPKIVVDYAHTPDGLQNVLQTLKETCCGKLIAVFGCGGNRDRSKRKIMATIGTQIASVCIFTSDNPRDEDPEDILRDMTNELSAGNYICIPDRANAIDFAIRLACPDDCVAICGKGEEKYIEMKGKKVPFNDKEYCLSVLENRLCQKLF